MKPAVARAREFAMEAHGDQKYGDQPYMVHLDAVASILQPQGEQAQVVGYLHDVLEDTATPREALATEFGEQVAHYVGLLTDGQYATRAERKAKTNAKLAACSGADCLALVVKAADRLANVRVSAANGPPEKLEKYRREHGNFRAAAYRPGLCDDLWTELDRILDFGP
jgi:(p)ppGpp synthase/HD superfamily hydrolase